MASQPRNTPVPAAETAVSAKKATIAEIEMEENSESSTEMEREVPQKKVSQEEWPELKTGPIEKQPSAKTSVLEPTLPQPSKELQPGDKVYIAGFGWVEYEGSNHCEDSTDIYENGNKIGVMG